MVLFMLADSVVAMSWKNVFLFSSAKQETKNKRTKEQKEKIYYCIKYPECKDGRDGKEENYQGTRRAVRLHILK